jgi:hypothetical protein
MQTRHRKYILLAALIAITPFLTACGLSHQSKAATGAREESTPAQASPGEHEGTVPASAQTEAAPLEQAGSPQQAVEHFATGYINWTYETLAGDASRLAASAVGEARALEEQTRAKATGDTPLQRAHIYNTGTVIAVVPFRGGQPNEWVVVTREQTGGSQEYAGIQAAFHITLATVQQVATGRWAVSVWRPQV